MPERAGVPRVGLGFDVHPRDANRPLLLGGVHFEGEPGVAGHSDGDVVCHAIADALLGAAGLGDIGTYFPDTDASVEGIAGSELLGRATALVRAEGLHPVSCDATVLADRPAIAPRRGDLRASLAAVLGVDAGAVSVKGTRPEGLGLNGDGVACIAIAMLLAGPA
ncbi:MAG: 2-C-methyl-D-erythritol 2,4-cyclodiphosphate synthase [Actinomycetota bacterium]